MRALLEAIPKPPGQSFALREFRLPRFTMPWHFHAEIELTLIVAGRGLRHVGDHIGRFGRGDLVLVGSNLPHYWWNDKGDRRHAHSIVVQFGAELTAAGFLALPEAAKIAGLLDRAKRGLLFRGAARNRAAGALHAMVAMRPWERLVALLALLGDLAEAGECGLLASAGYAPVLDARDGRRLGAVCGYVNEHHAEEIAQPRAARLAGLSPAAFSRYFRRRMGQTFEAYVNEVRVGHACRRLLEPDTTAAEAAFASGYNNLSNFNRRFRAIMGRTPTQFRDARENKVPLPSSAALREGLEPIPSFQATLSSRGCRVAGRFPGRSRSA